MSAAESLELAWEQCTDGWCRLNNVNLWARRLDDAVGVYLIWTNDRCVYVGQGTIRDRLHEHRASPAIQGYRTTGLWVTWARVRESTTRNRIERYLADTLQPAVGLLHPDVRPLAVNLPW